MDFLTRNPRNIAGIAIRHTLTGTVIAMRWADDTENAFRFSFPPQAIGPLLTTSLFCIEDAQLQTLCASACIKSTCVK